MAEILETLNQILVFQNRSLEFQQNFEERIGYLESLMNRHVITNRNENQNFDQDEQALSGIRGTNADAAAVEDNNIEVHPTDNLYLYMYS